MDLATLSALAEQLAPLVLQKIKGKGKKEVSELNTVSDYSNIYSMPCFYWNKETGEKKAVNLAMEAIVQSLEDAANEELIAIKQAATEAKESALESSSQAAEAERMAADAAEYALQQKEATELYLNTVLQNEEERKTAESERANAEAGRANAEASRVKAEQSRSSAEASRVSAENARISAENTRSNAEAGRVTAENARVSAENSRASAEAARIKAEQSRASQETGRVNAEAGRVAAESERVNEFASMEQQSEEATTAAIAAAANANKAASDSTSQTAKCKDATDLATEMNEHPLKYGDNGNWWKWNVETDKYEDTGIIAKGGGMYPMIRSRRNHVIWYDSTDSFKDRITRRRNHTVIKF